ncbi:MAG: phosphodiester glycosidase family protein [Clostridia bacterium]|nr:phosphodiester glycosidase family protein [Clostridia bacterium]
MKKAKILIFIFVILFCVNAYASADGDYLQSSFRDVYTVSYEISHGLSFTRSILDNVSGSNREYVLEYVPNDDTKIAFSSGKYLYSADYIRNLAKYEEPDMNYVAGINADFFNMSTGVPESALIKDGELYTSDMDTFCLAQDENNAFFIDKPATDITLISGKDGIEYHILRLNKDFTRYGIYLYNERYSDNTHTGKSTVTTSALMKKYEFFFDINDIEEYLDISDDEELLTLLEEYYADETEPELTEEETKEPEESEEQYNVFDEIVSVLQEKYACEYVNGIFYKISDIKPQINSEENLVVVSVDANSVNANIPENTYVFCADNETYGYILMSFAPGDTFALKIDGNEKFDTVKNAIGTGTVIVSDSEIIEDYTLSHYAVDNPRSAVGIREDGTLVLYAVDGRQKPKSSGFTLGVLAQRMKELGCVYAANLDGGDSTAVNVSMHGFDSANTQNFPSGKSERKVSNAVCFFNELEKDGTPAFAYNYSDYNIIFSDSDIEFDNIVLSDKFGFAVNEDADKEAIIENASFYTKDGSGMVADRTFYPMGAVGDINIYSRLYEGASENVLAVVRSIYSPDKINFSSDKYEIAPFENAKLEVSFEYGNLPVFSDNYRYIIHILPDENSETGGEENEDYQIAESFEQDGIPAYIADDTFFPLVSGKDYEISVVKGDAVSALTIKVDAYPFDDIENHWACREIYRLAKEKIVIGELNENGVYSYFPERHYSRYEFALMIQRITGIGNDTEIISEETAEEEENTLFADENDIPEWAKDAVMKLYCAGLLDDIMRETDGIITFCGDEYITRSEVMKVIGKLCESAPEDFDLSEFSDLDEAELEDANIKNSVYAEIFNGYEDSTLRLSNNLTRAEAAAVFVRLSDYLK